MILNISAIHETLSRMSLHRALVFCDLLVDVPDSPFKESYRSNTDVTTKFQQ
jgi:hypothetical protein